MKRKLALQEADISRLDRLIKRMIARFAPKIQLLEWKTASLHSESELEFTRLAKSVLQASLDRRQQRTLREIAELLKYL